MSTCSLFLFLSIFLSIYPSSCLGNRCISVFAFMHILKCEHVESCIYFGAVHMHSFSHIFTFVHASIDIDACVRPDIQHSHPSVHPHRLYMCALANHFLEICFPHRHFAASSSVPQLDTSSKSSTNARNTLQTKPKSAFVNLEVLGYHRMPLGPFVKFCRSGRAHWQQPRALHFAFSADGDRVYCRICARCWDWLGADVGF